MQVPTFDSARKALTPGYKNNKNLSENIFLLLCLMVGWNMVAPVAYSHRFFINNRFGRCSLPKLEKVRYINASLVTA